MAITTNRVYRGYVSTIDGTAINNQGDVRLQGNAESIRLMALGDLADGFEATETVQPTVTIATRDVASLLTLADPTSAAGGKVVGTLARFQFQEKGAAAAAHMIVDSPRGLLLVNDFGCNDRDNQGLVANCTYHALTDGTNAPLIAAGSASVSGTPTVTQVFRRGPIVWQGSVLQGVTSQKISTGFKTSLPPYQGIYPTDITIDNYGFSLEIAGTQLEAMTGLQIGQVYKLTSAVDVYFQAQPNGGIPTAFGTAAHIKVSFSSGTYRVDSPRASGTGNATLSIMLSCIDTVNNRALKPTITLNSVISV